MNNLQLFEQALIVLDNRPVSAKDVAKQMAKSSGKPATMFIEFARTELELRYGTPECPVGRV